MIVVTGADGMLGHKVAEVLISHDLDVVCTFRTEQGRDLTRKYLKNLGLDMIGSSLHLMDCISVLKNPIVINCVGYVKQRGDDSREAFKTNGLLPHQIADACAKLIHISTDCVFSGHTGNYTEEDLTDAQDVYGRSKIVGEVDYKPHLTLRTSIIGRELKYNTGLLEWFLSQDEAKGYTNHFWSGLPTIYLAQIIYNIITEYPHLTGLYQICSKPVTKFHLLEMFSHHLKKINVEPSSHFPKVDRTLKCDKFEKAIGYIAPSWSFLMHELEKDSKKYDFLQK